MRRIVCIDLEKDQGKRSENFKSTIHKFQKLGFWIDLVTTEEKLVFWQKENSNIDFFYKKRKGTLPKVWLENIKEEILFLKKMRACRDKGVVVYVNSKLSWSLILMTRLLGLKVIIQVAFDLKKKTFLQRVLNRLMGVNVPRVFFNEQKNNREFDERGIHFNPITGALVNKLTRKGKENLVVFLHAKMSQYKQIHEFVEMAKKLPFLTFELVIEESMGELKKIFEGTYLPDNLIVFPAQKSYHDFYRRAYLIAETSQSEQREVNGLRSIEEKQIKGIPAIPSLNGHAVLEIKK